MTNVVTKVRPATALDREEAAAVDGVAFREAMSRIAASVHVVTSDGAFGRGGATMTAVTSVTDSPPTLLVCLNRTGRLAGILRGNGVFCVNTLVAGDEDLAAVFAGRGGLDHAARFAHGAWTVGETGAPLLVGARASLDCRVSDVAEIGSHLVVFGRVAAVRLGAVRAPLIYVDRGYHVLPGLDAAD